MAIDYSKLAFASTLRYMRKYQDYVIGPGGGSVSHNLGYVPYFIIFAQQPSDDYLVAIRTGNVFFPNGDSAFYIINATTSTITVTEDFPPTNATNYYLRVYGDPLP